MWAWAIIDTAEHNLKEKRHSLSANGTVSGLEESCFS